MHIEEPLRIRLITLFFILFRYIRTTLNFCYDYCIPNTIAMYPVQPVGEMDFFQECEPTSSTITAVMDVVSSDEAVGTRHANVR